MVLLLITVQNFLRERLRKLDLLLVDLTSKNATVIKASYLVAQRIKTKNTHTTVEELILPCAKDIVSIMIGNDYTLKLQPLCLPQQITSSLNN
jgi:hypothetical protein